MKNVVRVMLYTHFELTIEELIFRVLSKVCSETS